MSMSMGKRNEASHDWDRGGRIPKCRNCGATGLYEGRLKLCPGKPAEAEEPQEAQEAPRPKTPGKHKVVKVLNAYHTVDLEWEQVERILQEAVGAPKFASVDPYGSGYTITWSEEKEQK